MLIRPSTLLITFRPNPTQLRLTFRVANAHGASNFLNGNLSKPPLDKAHLLTLIGAYRKLRTGVCSARNRVHQKKGVLHSVVQKSGVLNIRKAKLSPQMLNVKRA